ncbi:hypothetical protein [Sphingobium sp. AP50]|uniref:hypothetical protein n=1 Tax=Sphingobium sp. AP50 TaxID=1884369 RepID=UPI001160115C|nr:hypothetical protein [Sphingobium sp. AP50]
MKIEFDGRVAQPMMVVFRGDGASSLKADNEHGANFEGASSEVAGFADVAVAETGRGYPVSPPQNLPS